MSNQYINCKGDRMNEFYKRVRDCNECYQVGYNCDRCKEGELFLDETDYIKLVKEQDKEQVKMKCLMCKGTGIDNSDFLVPMRTSNKYKD